MNNREINHNIGTIVNTEASQRILSVLYETKMRLDQLVQDILGIIKEVKEKVRQRLIYITISIEDYRI